MKSNALAAPIGVLTKVTKWIIIISIIAMAVMLIINVIEVVGSKLFDWSFSGSLELTEQLMVIVSLLPISYIALERGHINITMVTDRIPFKVRYAFEILGYVLGILIMAFFFWRVFVQMQYTMNMGQETPVLDFPRWITNLIIMISFGLLGISWLLLLIKSCIVGPKK
ncbi:MAG: TRAP transporter small permease [Dehalococcoidales bacterium]|nr:TRAP transporter small permease [Dehalococcoidales bacterium]